MVQLAHAFERVFFGHSIYLLCVLVPEVVEKQVASSGFSFLNAADEAATPEEETGAFGKRRR